ncbi:phosphoadenosine phosphosulfate reductase [archaeon]|nr:MAG: phosphoadenosine phosphosulfate reductase [archaeon]HDM23357.1 phosphoadenosine phosphosulfate reductase [Candidatus Bathyarchaeota archaeon]
MFRVIVRAKRDADALRAMLSVFYTGWNIEARTFKGKRDPDRALEILNKICNHKKYNIILLGREDSQLQLLQSNFDENTTFHVVRKKKIRNTKLKALAKEFELARSRIRNTVSWHGNSYVFSHKYKVITREANTSMDIFIGIGEGYSEIIEKLTGIKVENPLFIRVRAGIHRIYSGPNEIATINIPDKGKVEVLSVNKGAEIYDVELNGILNNNRKVLRLHENIAINFLKQFKRKYDKFIVPWSGGKDSTACLLLALKTFGKEKVTPIYVDTGVDFPQSPEYIEKISGRLGIKFEKVYAPVKESLKEKGFPTHENRWCTVLKVEALYAKVREITEEDEQVLIVVGDRDSESRSRSLRPTTRLDQEFTIVAPIRMWNTAITQLYILSNGIPLNPLYLQGFYRLGCYICPSLRSWEKEIMKRKGHMKLLEQLEN